VHPVALALGILGAAIAVSLWFMGRTIPTGSAALRLRGVQKARVADAANGEVVKLAGVARPLGGTVRLDSEFSKEDVLYFRFWAHYSKSDPNSDLSSALTSSTDVVMGTARDATPFLLDDGTGSILIDPQDVDFVLPPKDLGQFATLDLFPKQVSPTGSCWVAKEPPPPLRYEQETLAPGQTITVVGRVQRFDKDGASHIVLRRPSSSDPVLVTTFDENGLGNAQRGCSLVALCMFLLCAALVAWAVSR